MNKYQEALNHLKDETIENFKKKHIPTYEERTKIINDVVFLQELVDKVTPKKPKNWKAERRLNGAVEFNCPVCNRLYNERVNFCASCGQALDWSEE